METFCRSLDQLSKGLLARSGGDITAEIPTSLDAQLGSLRQALQEIYYMSYPPYSQ